MRHQDGFTDYATYKRKQWVHHEQSSIVELLSMWDLALVFILIQLVLAVLVLA